VGYDLPPPSAANSKLPICLTPYTGTSTATLIP
jgi:hypothetical protein